MQARVKIYIRLIYKCYINVNILIKKSNFNYNIKLSKIVKWILKVSSIKREIKKKIYIYMNPVCL